MLRCVPVFLWTGKVNINTDSKPFYKYVKQKRQVKGSVGPLKGRNGEISSDSKFMAEELNTFFASSFTWEDTNNYSPRHSVS